MNIGSRFPIVPGTSRLSDNDLADIYREIDEENREQWESFLFFFFYKGDFQKIREAST